MKDPVRLGRLLASAALLAGLAACAGSNVKAAREVEIEPRADTDAVRVVECALQQAGWVVTLTRGATVDGEKRDGARVSARIRPAPTDPQRVSFKLLDRGSEAGTDVDDLLPIVGMLPYCGGVTNRVTASR